MPKETPEQPKRMGFGSASGQIQSDFALEEKVGEIIRITKYVAQERTYDGRATHIVFVYLEDGTIGYTWSEPIKRNLDSIKDSLDKHIVVEALVSKDKGKQGDYLTLKDPAENKKGK